MKILRSIAVAGALVLLAVPQVQAQITFELAPFAGGTFFLADPPDEFALDRGTTTPLILEDGSFDHAVNLGVNTGFVINDRWAIEGMFSWTPTKVSAAHGLAEKANVNAFMYGVTGLFYLPVETRARPFLGVGFGAETFDYDLADVETHTDYMGNVVLGVYVPLRSGMGLRMEARDCFARFDAGVSGIDDSWENDLMLTMGFSYRVGIR